MTCSLPRAAVLAAAALLTASTIGSAAAQPPDFMTFESGHVRPLAMSPDGTRLFAVNTPDGFLEIFDLTGAVPVRTQSVQVGLEPVAVAARNNSEVWVVNHLSDSISIVNVSTTPARVVRTLLVGDEPNDIVFAGPGGNRAFITTAHRGQNSPYPQGDYDVEGIGRADVWVFDATNLGTALGGTPLTIVTLFGDKPRALTTAQGGTKVYAAIFHSGNQTTVLQEGTVPNNSNGLPQPRTNFQGITGPQVGLIVGFNAVSGDWEDELGRDWSSDVAFSLPDEDVFEIDAMAATPVETDSATGVGTILFNMIENPVNGNIYVSNTEANNRVRFEGLGDYVSVLGPKPSGDPPSVRGHLHEARITVLDSSLNATPRHLNKHLDYQAHPQPAGAKEKSLATPLGMAITSDGATLYVAGFGSNAVGVYNTAQLENDTFVPSAASKIPISGGLPTGVLLDEPRGRLYVMARFTNRVITINTTTQSQVALTELWNPEPGVVKLGRLMLYDANLTGSNGEAACGSCHVFGDMDDLAWDLGDPDGVVVPNPNPAPPAVDFFPINNLQPFHPMKGPMTTQSLRGMRTAGPMHWRGDRTGGSSGGDPLDEVAAFNAFNVAFPGLIGRDEGELDPGLMQFFTLFALEIRYPPNPVRQLNNTLRADEQDGNNLFFGRITDTVANCNGCHVTDRSQGFFGTGGGSTFEAETQEFKVPHLRNAYQKIGMFGLSGTTNTGPQVRGVGFLHDGSVDTMFNFLGAGVFSLSNAEQRDLEEFTMAFDSDLAPIVGQQVTLRSTSGTAVNNRVDLLIQRAGASYSFPEHGAATECDLVVKGVIAGVQRGWVRQSNGTFKSDKAAEAAWSESALRALANTAGQELTFTCVPPGSGTRMGINRDRDGLLNGDDPVPDRPPPACGGGGSAMVPSAMFFVALLAAVRKRWGA